LTINRLNTTVKLTIARILIFTVFTILDVIFAQRKNRLPQKPPWGWVGWMPTGQLPEN